MCRYVCRTINTLENFFFINTSTLSSVTSRSCAGEYDVVPPPQTLTQETRGVKDILTDIDDDLKQFLLRNAQGM